MKELSFSRVQRRSELLLRHRVKRGIGGRRGVKRAGICAVRSCGVGRRHGKGQQSHRDRGDDCFSLYEHCIDTRIGMTAIRTTGRSGPYRFGVEIAGRLAKRVNSI